MTMRLIPHAAAMTEFVTDPTDGVRYTGTCGEDAGLALAHPIDPAKWPLNAATLASIARWEIGKKQASANGSEPISAIASWLTAESITHTSYGYAEPPSFDWRGMLATWGGIKPIVFEYANAQALPDDERGVAYHFNCCLGWDPAAEAGLFADGDNLVEREGGTALVRYTLANLEAAHLCGMLVGEYELGGVMTTVPTGWTDNGKVLTAPNGVKVDTGFRLKILEGNWDPANLPLAPAFDVPEVEIANPEHGPGQILYCTYSALFWTPKENVVVRSWVGREAMTMRAQLTTLEAQAARDAAELASQRAQVTTLQAQVKSLNAQLTAAAKPPVAPVAPTTPADAAALLVALIYAQAEATLKATTQPPATS